MKNKEKKIAVLFVEKKSIYKSYEICDCYDKERDALTFKGSEVVIAHPPCRQWGKLYKFAKVDTEEKALAVWAVFGPFAPFRPSSCAQHIGLGLLDPIWASAGGKLPLFDFKRSCFIKEMTIGLLANYCIIVGTLAPTSTFPVSVLTKICMPPLSLRTKCKVDSFWML